MKLRIISDLHRCINRKYPLELANNCDYTLIAGDIGPDYRKNVKWIKQNVRMGAFISGNHDAYGTSRDFTIEDVKEYYHKRFPLDSEVTYFDYDVGVIKKEIADGILLVADVLYTDYELACYDCDKSISKDVLVKKNMERAYPKMSGSYMNDFMHFSKSGYISPEDYLRHFRLAFAEISRIVKENRDREIILMTHHCLSPRCIGPYMGKGSLSASYASDKSAWIGKNKNIKLIVSGHVHNSMEFHVGNTLYVMNPLGYCTDHQDRNWTPDFFVDTDTWTVSKTPYENEEWNKRHEHDDKSFCSMGLFV